MSALSMFLIFFWKNYKYVKFHWKSTLLILIGCMSILTIYLKATYSVTESSQIIYEQKDEEFLRSLLSGENDDVICYSPSTNLIDELMEKVRLDLSITGERIRSFDDETDMHLYFEQKKKTRSFAISFLNFSSTSYHQDLKYTISSTNGITSNSLYLNDKQVVGIKDYDNYISTGFFILQYTIDKNFVQLFGANEAKISMTVSPFPRQAFNDIDDSRMVSFGMIFILLLYILLLSTLLVPWVEEKQDGIKEFLVLATPFNYMNGITFYMIRFFIYLIFMITALIVSSIYEAIGLIGISYISILFFLFIISAMSYTYLISLCFNSVFYAKVGGFISYLVPSVLFSIEGSIFAKFSFMLSANVFLEAMTTFQIFSNKKRDFSVENLFINITENSYKLITIYALMIGQTVIYLLLYLYLSYIFPGKGGVRKPFYFIFQPSFYSKVGIEPNQNVEDPLQPEPAIKIRNLTKIFKTFRGKEKLVINQLNMNIKNKRITVLLGHNGAGKTTTINTIIGSVQKTGGDIIVDGKRDVSSYRHLIGYCPQHSIFMQYLTCLEHLQFFAQIRGLSKKQAKETASNLLGKLNLERKANEVGKNLSGGMKRRLSLGMAITGNTKIIILDEPSSGLDPESRRELWNILLQARKTQAILVTTHHMEEAEVLGDEITIMSHGKVICNGTSLELKRTYGSGYVLKLLVGDTFDFSKTQDLIKEFIPNIKVQSFVEPTLCISLPYESQTQYVSLLAALEHSMTRLGLVTISITDTSLEEVFLNCENNQEDHIDTVDFAKDIGLNIPYVPIQNQQIDPTKSPKILAHQSFAVLYKKIIYIRREWLYALFMFSIPFITMILSFWAMNTELSNSDDLNQLKLNINIIPQSDIYLKIPSGFESLKNYMENEIRKGNGNPIFVENDVSMNDVLLMLQHKNITYFYDNVLGACELNNDGDIPILNIYYSGNIIHSSVIMLNLVDNIVLKYITNENLTIETTSIPIKKSSTISPTKLEYYSSMLPVGWFFYMLFYVSLPYKEERTEFKSLQNLSGAVYWLSFTTVDVILHVIICLLVGLVQKLFDWNEIYNDTDLIWFTTSFMLYGFAYLPIMYLMASSFKSMSSLSTCLFFIFIISTIIPIITSGNLSAMQEYDTIIYLMNLLPDFALKNQLKVIHENYFIRTRNDIIRNREEWLDSDQENRNFTGKQEDYLNATIFYFYMIFIMIFIEMLLILFWDDIYKRQTLLEFFSFKNTFKRSKNATNQPIAEDVLAEKKKVDEITNDNNESDYPLIVRNLHKFYGNLHAVKGINFTVKSGECFGLLGLNGAGKTSTFQMITGNEKISNGDVKINAVNINSNKNLFKFLFGYCPQTNALNNYMTSYEILKYMALLRGIRFCDVHNEILKWLEQLDLEKYKDLPIKDYSGGTKRKLNTAMAMIGDPLVIFLDEPTTGVDPKSRRFMWKCIQKFQKQNKTIVLTSHSMDECENLCNRLAIMSNGQFQCLGFIPALKNAFGSGFTVTFRIEENFIEQNVQKLNSNMTQHFICTLREQHEGVLTYFVEEKPILWSKVFSRIQNIIRTNNNIIKDYSINETTLEDIFLKFESTSKDERTSSF